MFSQDDLSMISPPAEPAPAWLVAKVKGLPDEVRELVLQTFALGRAYQVHLAACEVSREAIRRAA